MIETFEKQTITYEKPKVNVGFMKRKSQAHTFLGELYGDLMKCNADGNLEMGQYILSLIESYNKFHTKARVELISWRGKSGIQIIQKPDSFDVIRYRKKDKNSKPKEIVKNILKEDINKVIQAIGRSNFKEKIPTRQIAKEYCKIVDLDLNSHNRALFEGDEFIWDNFFADRQLHTFLTDVLDLLEYYEVINYCGGFTKILKKVMDIQEIL